MHAERVHAEDQQPQGSVHVWRQVVLPNALNHSRLHILSDSLCKIYLWQVFLPNGPLALLPVRDGYSNIVWSTTPAQAAELEAMTPDSFVSAVNMVRFCSVLVRVCAKLRGIGLQQMNYLA